MRTVHVMLVCCVLLTGCSPHHDRAPLPSPRALRWDPFLDTLQLRTLRYFLETEHPRSGLSPDRWPSPSPSSIAAVGFDLTCLPISVERGLLPRGEAAVRVLRVLRFLRAAPQGPQSSGVAGYRGFFYHFIDLENGARAWRCELSTVDTGLLLAGALFCQSYFDQALPVEDSIRAVADTLYRRVDWRWAMGDTTGVWMAWRPEDGWSPLTWFGYNEAMILYILALGSPTHGVPETVWDHWTKPYVWGPYYGSEFVSFGPLFGHQYSHCWIDFRGIQDAYMRQKGTDYFENSRRATYTHRAYAAENPDGWTGYADSIWGLSACDGPKDTVFHTAGARREFYSYRARGVSFDWKCDDGTLAPNAAGGSVAFAPEICIPALKAMRNRFGAPLWTEWGFRDAFNPTFVTPATGPQGWVDRDFLGIDQGPIAIMIENLRNELIWSAMKKSPYVIRGLQRAGFAGGWLAHATVPRNPPR